MSLNNERGAPSESVCQGKDESNLLLLCVCVHVGLKTYKHSSMDALLESDL